MYAIGRQNMISVYAIINLSIYQNFSESLHPCMNEYYF